MSSEELTGYGKYVVITRKRPPEKTDGGVIIPETAMRSLEPEYVGTVVSIGEKVTGSLEVGDRITYHHCFPLNGGPKGFAYAIVHEDNITARVSKQSSLVPDAPTKQAFSQS